MYFAWISYFFPAIPSKDSTDEISTGNLQAFDESIQLDVECATRIVDSLEKTAIEKFVNIMENCSGRILLTGIGKSSSLVVS